MAGEREPLFKLTPNDHGPIIIVVGYSLAFISVVTATARFLHAAHRRIKFGRDDVTYLVSNALAILSSVMLHLAVRHGLGKHISTLTDNNIDKFSKTLLAAHCLEIVAMFFAKLSFLLLLDRMSSSLPSKFMILSGLLAWAIFSLIASLICRFTPPWTFSQSHCHGHGTLLYPEFVFNALSDAILAFWAVPSVWAVSMPRRNKFLVMVLFGIRILVCIPLVIQTALLRSYLDSTDLTWTSFDFAILNQLTVYLSVMCATIPRLNQFLFTLQSGRATLRVPDFEIHTFSRAFQTEKSTTSQSS